MEISQIGVRFPGSENLLDRQTMGIDADPVIFCRNACDFPFRAVFFDKPFAAINQQPGKSPTDFPKADERKIYLFQALFHRASVRKIVNTANPDGDITTCGISLQ